MADKRRIEEAIKHVVTTGSLSEGVGISLGRIPPVKAADQKGHQGQKTERKAAKQSAGTKENKGKGARSNTVSEADFKHEDFQKHGPTVRSVRDAARKVEALSKGSTKFPIGHLHEAAKEFIRRCEQFLSIVDFAHERTIGSSDPNHAIKEGLEPRQQTQVWWAPNEHAVNYLCLLVKNKLGVDGTVEQFAQDGKGGWKVKFTGSYADHDISVLAGPINGVYPLEGASMPGQV